MHWTTHIIVGASLGYATGKPFMAELAGVAGHLVMDMVPHHDPETDFGHFIDAALGITTLSIIAGSRTAHDLDPDRALLFGAIGGALPDCELLTIALDKDFDPERLLFPSHNGLLPHGHTESKAFSYSLEAIAILTSVFLAMRKLRIQKSEVKIPTQTLNKNPETST